MEKLQLKKITASFIGPKFSAVGGNITYVNNYVYHYFSTTGTFVCTGKSYIEITIVGGGGGGGCGFCESPNGAGGGGGAAGTVKYINNYLASGITTVVVGSGGPGGSWDSQEGSNGNFSSFAGIIAQGGGGGYGNDGGYEGGSNSMFYGGMGESGGGGGAGGGGNGYYGDSGQYGYGGLYVNLTGGTWSSITYLAEGGCGNAAGHILYHGGGSGGDFDSYAGDGYTPGSGGGGVTGNPVNESAQAGAGYNGVVLIKYPIS